MFLERLSSVNYEILTQESLRKVAYYASLLFDPKKRLRRRHLREARDYEKGRYFERYYECRWLYTEAIKYAQCLADSGLIPKPDSDCQKTIILSTSSNYGITERELQRLLGSGYLIIANDLANIQRCKGIPHLKSDASFLPFAPNSIHFLYDFKGALWYETDLALRKGVNVKNVLFLLTKYIQVLKPNGYFVTDFTSSQNLTNLGLDSNLPSGLTKIKLNGETFPQVAYLKLTK